MKYLLYATLVPLSIAAKLLTILLSPLVVLFCKRDGYLPSCLSLFQPSESGLDYVHRTGISMQQDGPEVNIIKKHDSTIAYSFQVYLRRLRSILEYPGYGFDYYLFGLPWVRRDWRVPSFISAYDKEIFISKCQYGFNFYYYGPLGLYHLGWRTWDHFDRTYKNYGQISGTNAHIPLVFKINPFRRKPHGC